MNTTTERTLPLLAAAALLSTGATAWAQDTPPVEQEHSVNTLLDAVANGEVTIKLRYRFENVEQDGISKDAHASTLRTVLNYATQPLHGFQAVIEFEDVRAIGDEAYNDTLNGEPRPVVADPEGTELNQGFLNYDLNGHGDARLGRQRITLDNHRFIGNVGWRQNEQTYDAVSVDHALGEHGHVFAAYLDNVNRVFGESSPAGDARMGSILLNASFETDYGKLTGYWYDLDYDDAVTLSTSTFGGRFAGSAGDETKLLYALEVAMQEDTGDNPNSVDADYANAELGLGLPAVTIKVGMESLSGGTGGDMFTTPLATLHAFNGWADKFLNTPAGGLEDSYVSASAELAGGTAVAVYHDFQGETSGSGDYGTELDLAYSRPVGERVTWGVKYANYMEDGLFTDTEKFWVWMALSL